MDLSRRYKDSGDNPRNILEMVEREPEWAANMIQAGEVANKQIKYLQETNDKHLGELEDVTDKLRLCVCRLFDAEMITGSRACELLGGIKMQDFHRLYKSDWVDKW